MSRHFWDIVLILDRLLGFGATHVWKAIRSLLHTLPGSTPTHKWTKGRIVWGHSCCTTLVQHSILKKVFVWGEIQFPNIYSIWGKLWIFMATSLELFDLEVLYGPSSQQNGLWSSLALPITLSYSLKRGRWLGSTITLAHRDLQRQTEFVIFMSNDFLWTWFVRNHLLIIFVEMVRPKSFFSFCAQVQHKTWTFSWNSWENPTDRQYYSWFNYGGR